MISLHLSPSESSIPTSLRWRTSSKVHPIYISSCSCEFLFLFVLYKGQVCGRGYAFSRHFYCRMRVKTWFTKSNLSSKRPQIRLFCCFSTFNILVNWMSNKTNIYKCSLSPFIYILYLSLPFICILPLSFTLPSSLKGCKILLLHILVSFMFRYSLYHLTYRDSRLLSVAYNKYCRCFVNHFMLNFYQIQPDIPGTSRI